MAKRDILKEAIADAKTVKETAIANAKAALEEAFTPRLKEMLATKLEEMDLDEEEEALEEKKKYSDDNRPKGDKGVKGGAEERATLKDEEKIKKTNESLDEEIDLDEILAEIEEMDDKEVKESEDPISEDERTRAEEEGFLDGEEDADKDMKDKEDEEIDLEDMTDDDLKGFIEDVIADMVASGELEAGENFEEEGEEEMEMDTEVDVDISEAKKKDKEKDNKEPMEESIDIEESTDVDEAAVGTPTSTVARGGNKFDAMSNEELAKYLADKITSGAKGAAGKILGGIKKLFGLSEELDEVTGMPTSNVARGGNKFDAMSNTEVAKYFLDKLKAGGDRFRKTVIALLTRFKLEEAEYMEEELSEAYSTIETLKSDLNEGLKTKKTPMIKESLGAASRVSRSVNAKKPIIETDPMVERFKKLAGIK